MYCAKLTDVKSLTFTRISSRSKIIEKRNAQLSNHEVLALLRELDEKQKEQVRINPQIKFAENLKTIQFEVKLILVIRLNFISYLK